MFSMAQMPRIFGDSHFTSKNNICNVYLAICKYIQYVNRSYSKDVNMAEYVRFDQGGVDANRADRL